MVQKTNPKKIGLFVCLSLFIFIGTFVLINKDKFFSTSLKYVLYFDGSIKGLNVGAPVLFNGVPIGRVTGISLITDMETMQIQTPVYIETNEQSFIVQNTPKKGKIEIESFTEKMIKKGLRARLESQSLLTGQMMIGLGFYPETQAVLKKHPSKFLEIPTLPSATEALSRKLQNLPLEKTMTHLNELLDEIHNMISIAKKDSPEILSNIKEVTGTLTSVAKKTENALNSFDESSTTMIRLNKMLDDFSAAARSLRNWADYLERHPEALLRGKGGF